MDFTGVWWVPTHVNMGFEFKFCLQQVLFSLQVDFIRMNWSQRKWKLIDGDVKKNWSFKNYSLNSFHTCSEVQCFHGKPVYPLPQFTTAWPPAATHTHSSHDAVCVALWRPGKQTRLFSHFSRKINWSLNSVCSCQITNMTTLLAPQLFLTRFFYLLLWFVLSLSGCLF